VKLVRKGFRKGRAVSWRALLAGARPDVEDDEPTPPTG
jgi:hypothetical protein